MLRDQCLPAVCLSQLLTEIICVFPSLCYSLFLQPSHRRVVQPSRGSSVLRGAQWVCWQSGRDGGHHISQDQSAVRLRSASLGARAQSENQNAVNILQIRTAWDLTGSYLQAEMSDVYLNVTKTKQKLSVQHHSLLIKC